MNATLGMGQEHRTEFFREATIMVLYVSVVEIAELAALPSGQHAGGDVAGPVGRELLAILWGTAIGLWNWHAITPGLGLAMGNPPSGAVSGYVLFDIIALAVTARVLRRRRVVAQVAAPPVTDAA